MPQSNLWPEVYIYVYIVRPPISSTVFCSILSLVATSPELFHYDHFIPIVYSRQFQNSRSTYTRVRNPQPIQSSNQHRSTVYIASTQIHQRQSSMLRLIKNIQAQASFFDLLWPNIIHTIMPSRNPSLYRPRSFTLLTSLISTKYVDLLSYHTHKLYLHHPLSLFPI